jgi:hypothetical protein
MQHAAPDPGHHPGHVPADQAAWDEDDDDRPRAVSLAHPVFARFQDVYFRRAAGDGTPVMVVQLAEAPATLPLRALQREFAIPDDSPDGLVLGMIGEALDFVGVLRLGDPFPPEILSGLASWQPEKRHFELALSRLRAGLVAGLDSNADRGAQAWREVAARADFSQRLADAFRAAAAALGLARPEQVVAMVEELAGELAHIEYLRERLMAGMVRMQAVLTAVLPAMRADRNRLETAMHVSRLLAVAIERSRIRFDEIDGQTAEVMAALRNLPAQRAFISSTRDYLHRSWRAFQPILARWLAMDAAAPVGLRAAVDEAYAFLAPRYMTVQDWLDSGRRAETGAKENRMEW